MFSQLRFFKILGTIYLLLSSHTYCNTEEPCDFIPEIANIEGECLPLIEPIEKFLSFEFLYLKPAIEQSSFVITSSDNQVEGEFFPSGHRHFNSARYKPAYRATFAYLVDNDFFDVKTTYYDANHSRSKKGFYLFDTLGYPGDGAQAPEDINYEGKAKIHDYFKFCSLEACYNKLAMQCRRDAFFLKIGMQYALIKHKRHFKSIGFYPDGLILPPVKNKLASHSLFWGIGPQLGLDYYHFFKYFDNRYGSASINVLFQAALLCGESSGSLHYKTLRTAGSSGINLHNSKLWRVIPAFDARVAATYEFSLFCANGLVQAGYEWIWYHHSVDTITGLDVAFAGNTLDVYNNLSLHGPFLKIGFNY